MGLFKRKKEPDAFQLLTEQCRQALDSADMLVEFMRNPREKEMAAEIEAGEKSADLTQRTLNNYLANTFITPVSRHYLFRLARVIDDITDEIKDLKDFILFFDYSPTEKNIEMAECCRQSVEVLVEALEKWRGDESKAMWTDLIRIRKNENHVKRIYWQNLKEIEESDSIRDVISYREFCHDLRALSKKIAKVADRIGDLVIKSIK
jgi:uncharacterized protein Yka (UPF0111/DUF47 family)